MINYAHTLLQNIILQNIILHNKLMTNNNKDLENSTTIPFVL